MLQRGGDKDEKNGVPDFTELTGEPRETKAMEAWVQVEILSLLHNTLEEMNQGLQFLNSTDNSFWQEG